MSNASRIIRKRGGDQNIEAIHKVTDLLKTVHYGSITLHIQAGKVYQINRTESRRLAAAALD
ncbi:YezD family protein [Geomonas subterranea]|uniref:YezD family protein n=1 Tax=Geomonas subterranea TaxID=2847989 RepID=A0ABX8LL56_9BACT|nr:MULTISPECIES: YezD family protein [Geomonas]QXE91364.1 YezD family protein [Geomonas subterranea]QXM10549.1 YezD family protein [Geomonas subterranea]